MIWSTIESLNLSPVKSGTCMASKSCALAKIKGEYRGKYFQFRLGACLSNNLCFGTAGCNVALKYLPSGATSQECKVV